MGRATERAIDSTQPYKMQQSVPNPPHQVIHIVEAPNYKANIKDAYNAKAATVLGVLHIICGVISLAAQSALLESSWTSTIFIFMPGGPVTILLFFISGGLAIGGARSGNKCLVVATMVMSIISALVAGILLLISARYLNFLDDHPSYPGYQLLVFMGVMMLGVAIASASLTCKPFCCRSTNQGSVHYNPNQVPTSVLVNPNYNTNPNAQPLQTSVNPPVYEEVVGTGSNYQRF